MDSGIEKLLVWQKAMGLVEEFYKVLLPSLPESEKYGLNSQIRRALVSIPANIAEGHGRYYYREGVRFCLISRGSLEEVRTYIYLMSRLNYISVDQLNEMLSKLNEIRRMLNGYIQYLQQQSEKESKKINEQPLDSMYFSTRDDANDSLVL